jgi:hypothetical protein
MTEEVERSNSAFVTRLCAMKLHNLRQVYGNMTFREVVELAEQSDDYLSAMNVFDPAWKKFTHDRRVFWEYAWLLTSESGGTFSPSDSHVKYHNFIVAHPWQQPNLDWCGYKEWLHNRKEDVCEEWGHWLPVYLRPDEVASYALKIYHHHKGLNGHGWLAGIEIEELAVEDDPQVLSTLRNIQGERK